MNELDIQIYLYFYFKINHLITGLVIISGLNTYCTSDS